MGFWQMWPDLADGLLVEEGGGQELDLEMAIELAVQLCYKFEGLYLRPYICPGGVATVGLGSTRYEDGTRVTLKDPAITPARAEELLRHQLQTVYLPAVLKLCPGAKNTEQVAALLDFTYNLGGSNLKTSTLRKRVNAERWDEVPAEFRKWVKGGGRVLKGLVRRREAEIALL